MSAEDGNLSCCEFLVAGSPCSGWTASEPVPSHPTSGCVIPSPCFVTHFRRTEYDKRDGMACLRLGRRLALLFCCSKAAVMSHVTSCLRRSPHGRCSGLPGLLEQNATDSTASKTGSYFFTVLEAGKSRTEEQQGCYLMFLLFYSFFFILNL